MKKQHEMPVIDFERLFEIIRREAIAMQPHAETMLIVFPLKPGTGDGQIGMLDLTNSIHVR
jgi:hypothetical protein